MAKKKLDDKNNQNDDNTKNEGDLTSNDEEPNFSDPEGFVDDISDEGICSRSLLQYSTITMLFVMIFLEKLLFIQFICYNIRNETSNVKLY